MLLSWINFSWDWVENEEREPRKHQGGNVSQELCQLFVFFACIKEKTHDCRGASAAVRKHAYVMSAMRPS